MHIQYLEIVTSEVDVTCLIYSKTHGVSFSELDPRLGQARTAKLNDGGMIGVRTPMHESEEPVIRVYMLVKDIELAISEIVDSGAEILHPPLEIPDLGTFAIYSVGGNHHGFWQI